MKHNSKSAFTTLTAILLFCTEYSYCLPETRSGELNLTDKGKSIENSISFFTSKSEYENLKLKGGEKIYLKNSRIIINGDTLLAEDINTRGRSTLLFRRKSYSFTLKSEASFRHGEKREKFRKFYALSLSMDKNYTSNRLAYELMEKIHLFGLFYSFGQLFINGENQGICMIIERPEDWALKKKNSPLIIRRGYNESINRMERGKTIADSDIKNFTRYYKLIYKSLRKYDGEELYKQLSQWIDLENYMRWLAFNFLVRDGDYTDELDVKIANDPYLYKIYLLSLKAVLEQITEEILEEVFENTYAELFPYYSNHELIIKSVYDSHGETNLSKLGNDMRSLFGQLNELYRFYSNYLKDLN